MEDKNQNDKKITYLFGFSPFMQGHQIENLLNIIKYQVEQEAEISVVLMHDGVIGTSRKGKIPSHLTMIAERAFVAPVGCS